jgi:hypothetical protein
MVNSTLSGATRLAPASAERVYPISSSVLSVCVPRAAVKHGVLSSICAQSDAGAGLERRMIVPPALVAADGALRSSRNSHVPARWAGTASAARFPGSAQPTHKATVAMHHSRCMGRREPCNLAWMTSASVAPLGTTPDLVVGILILENPRIGVAAKHPYCELTVTEQLVQDETCPGIAG